MESTEGCGEIEKATKRYERNKFGTGILDSDVKADWVNDATVTHHTTTGS